MLGLDYYSSDEDEARPAQDVKEPAAQKSSGPQLNEGEVTNGQQTKDAPSNIPTPIPSSTTSTATQAHPPSAQSQLIPPPPPPPNAPPLGPIIGPSAPPEPDTPLRNADDAQSTTTSAPSSPHTRTQSILHSLTLPTHPNTSIPHSPPGSPRSSTTSKIRKFLDLKTRDIHFNAKLASSSALTNPELLKGLMEFAGVGAEYDQYASVLSEDVAVVRQGEQRVYWEELNWSQERILRKREEERKGGKRERVFVRGAAEESATVLREGKRRKG